MTNTERAIAFATECLGWTYTKHNECWRPDGKTWQFRWCKRDGSFAYGSRMQHCTPDQSLPPFGEDTPEGWAAHKRFVEPFIYSRGWTITTYSEGSGENNADRSNVIIDTPSGVFKQEFGPLPTATVEAALELVRKGKGDGANLR